MALTSRTALSVFTALMIPIGAGSSAPAPSPHPLRTDTEHAELVDWAFERFDRAGLELPDDTTVTYFDSTDPCEGNQGTVREARGNAVWICISHDKPEIELKRKEHVTLHELAHIWADADLSDADRRAFMDFRGATNWNDRSEDWWDRGTEQAAEVMVWGLLDRDPGFQRIHDRDCETMLAGFRILTGAEPLNPAAACESA